MVQFGILSLAIGHGPETPGTVGSMIMIVLGIVFGVAALAPGTHGKGSRVPIGSAERVIMLLVVFVLLTVGLRGLFH